MLGFKLICVSKRGPSRDYCFEGKKVEQFAKLPQTDDLYAWCAATLENKTPHDASFVWASAGRHNDKMKCHQWRQIYISWQLYVLVNMFLDISP